MFESDRGGQQQIYAMAADGSNQRRISFGDGSYSQPAWSPRGDYIAFTKRRAGGFCDRHHEAGRLGRAHPDRGLPQREPDLGPERPIHPVLPRSRRPVGRKLYMVDITGRVEQPIQTPSFASDPTWSPLLSENKG